MASVWIPKLESIKPATYMQKTNASQIPKTKILVSLNIQAGFNKGPKTIETVGITCRVFHHVRTSIVSSFMHIIFITTAEAAHDSFKHTQKNPQSK